MPTLPTSRTHLFGQVRVKGGFNTTTRTEKLYLIDGFQLNISILYYKGDYHHQLYLHSVVVWGYLNSFNSYIGIMDRIVALIYFDFIFPLKVFLNPECVKVNSR